MNIIEAPCPRTHDVLGRPLDSSCHIWQGLINRDGYAMRNKERAHRLVYEEVVGKIPDGYQVDHLCFVRACVNPAHLEAVTAKENYQRRAMRQTHCRHGHEYTPENTYIQTRADGRTCRNCRTCARLKVRAKSLCKGGCGKLVWNHYGKSRVPSGYCPSCLGAAARRESGQTPPELEGLTDSTSGCSTVDTDSALSGAGDLAVDGDGQLVLATPEFRRAAA